MCIGASICSTISNKAWRVPGLFLFPERHTMAPAPQQKPSTPPSRSKERIVHDLVDFETPRFDYRIRSADGTKVEKHIIDMDAALIMLQSRIGQVFQLHDFPVQDEVIVKGKKKIVTKTVPCSGLFILMHCYATSQPPPEKLPNLLEVAVQVRKTFSLPNEPGKEAGVGICLQLLDLFVTEAEGRRNLKKAPPVSPDSSAPTPA